MSKRDDESVTGVAALADPVRRALYDYVAEAADAVGRDEAAEAVGVSISRYARATLAGVSRSASLPTS